MSRVRLAAGGMTIAAVLLGSGAAGLAAWPMTPMHHSGQAASASGVLQGTVQLGRRVDVAFPESVVASGVSEVLVDVAVEVDADGAVTSARAATVTVHGGERQGASVSVPTDIDDMVTAAVDAIGASRFRAPAVAPARLIVGIRFAVETRQAVVVRIGAEPGYRTKPVLRAGGAIKPPTKVFEVQPLYPQEARDRQVQGVVVLDVIVAEDGTVKEVGVVQSIPELDAAAVDAVKQWRFEPTLLNGAAVPVQVTITVSFTLAP
jgi:TonB family protein